MTARVAGALAAVFTPRDALTDEQRQAGLRAMNYQAIAASGADGLISGGFLAAFALLLGASNVHIGILTALPPILQPVQLLAVVLIERLRMRKPFAVMSYFIAYAAWIPVALIPFALEIPNAGAVTLLLVFVALRGIAQAFLNPSWIGWIRDIVPQDVMGSFFSQRMRIATIAAAVAGLVGAFYIDWWAGRVPEPEQIYGYSYAMLFGSILLGFGAVGFMARMPEPRMVAPEGQRPTILQMLAAPLRDANYRQLMSFLMVWSLASQLAVPFFSVYMLTKLEMPLSAVVGLAVLSQATSVLFVNVWGGYVRSIWQQGRSVHQLVAISPCNPRVDVYNHARPARPHRAAAHRAALPHRHRQRGHKPGVDNDSHEDGAAGAVNLLSHGRILGRQPRRRHRPHSRRHIRGLLQRSPLRDLHRVGRSRPNR